MTTIAYRHPTIAGDTLVCSGTVKVAHIVKVGRTKDGHLWGFAGSLNHLEGFLEWVETREDEPDVFPTKDTTFIHITPDGRVREWWGSSWVETKAPYYAWGSGGELAIGAMAVGATAVEAVGAGILHDTSSGGDCISATL